MVADIMSFVMEHKLMLIALSPFVIVVIVMKILS